MSRTALILAGVLLGLSAIAVAAPAIPVVHCRRFIVGQANSTAYPHGRLPARGSARAASCSTLRRIARRLNDGTYRIPPGSTADSPRWGSRFPVHDRGRVWSCRLQNRGASGPTYAVRCQSGTSRLAWNTG